MLWLVPLTVGVIGLTALAFLAGRARRELAPTVALVDRYGREHRVALTAALERLRDETAHTHGRLSGN